MIFWIYWLNKIHFCVCAKSLQLHPTLFNHMDCSTPGFLPCKWEGCSLPGSSVLGASPGKNTGVGCHALLQGIFPTQGSNPGL